MSFVDGQEPGGHPFKGRHLGRPGPLPPSPPSPVGGSLTPRDSTSGRGAGVFISPGTFPSLVGSVTHMDVHVWGWVHPSPPFKTVKHLPRWVASVPKG